MTKTIALLPIYQNDKLIYFSNALNSLLEQTNLADILILIDGYVQQEMQDHINQVCDSTKVVSKIVFDFNRGLAAVLNDGIRYAIEHGYEFIARMDADDIALPNRFEKQLNFLKQNPEIDVLATSAYLIDKNDKIIGEKIYKGFINFRQLKFNCPIIHPSVIFRKSFFEKYGFYDTSLQKSQDYDLWLTSVKKGAKIYIMEDKLLYFRYDDNISARRKKEQQFNIIIKKKHFSVFEAKIYSIKHYLILLIPTFLIKFLLRFK